MERINLNDAWAVKEAPLHYGKDMSGHILAQKDAWYEPFSLPLDVRVPLIESGAIKDPALADYAFDSTWAEKRSWWFKKTFVLDKTDGFDANELVLESLDIHADIFINGAYLGHHASAYYPFRHDITDYILQGSNTLLIRLTTGLEYVSDADLAEIDFAVNTEAGNGCPERGDQRRAFLRKPAYVFGWDWCPRSASAAIGGNVYIERHNAASIRAVRMETLCLGADKTAVLRAHMEITLFAFAATAEADVSLTLSFDGQETAEVKLSDYCLRSGTNYITAEIPVEHARYWWPNGMGEQALYRVNASIACKGYISEYPEFSYGIRTIALDTSRMAGGGRRFALIVNGKPVFCKGGNWIPADLIYARVDRERYDTLVREARLADFNMLRIWGGGLYERDDFYDACDRYGILVWQDMMFACSSHPDHLTDFCALVGQELDYQTKRLAGRTCLAVLGGNNENHLLVTQWYRNRIKASREKQYGMKIYDEMIPEFVHHNCPWIPYWNGSPYGGGNLNDYTEGDVHYWSEGMMNPDMNVRIDPTVFDRVTARFVSEYGYPGPCVKETISRYFDGQPVERGGRIWNLHNNAFEKLTVNAGIKKFYSDSDHLTLDSYLLYAGAVQSLMLEYSLESLRFKDFCGGALFWMYNDCWGEVGWSIVDYDLHRKISYYGVRRAFAPVKLLLREMADGLTVVGCNDTQNEVSLTLAYGYARFDGSEDSYKTKRVFLPPYSRGEILVFDKGNHDAETGLWYVKPLDAPLNPALLRPLTKMNIAPRARLSYEKTDEGTVFTITGETYCHAAYLDVPARIALSDNYFSLLPGESKTVRCENEPAEQADSIADQVRLRFIF